MHAKSNETSLKLLFLFAAIYPICPYYFSILGIQFRDLVLCFTFVGILFVRQRYKIIVKKTVISLMIAILIWSVMTVAMQLYHGELAYAFRQLVLWLGICFVGSQLINTKEKFLKIIDILISVSVIVGLFGIIEEVTRFNVFSLVNTVNATLNYNPLRFGILRIISFTSHAITYCAYCVFIMTLIFYRVTVNKKKNNGKYFIVYAIIAINAFLTLSRSALIVLVGTQLLLLLFCGYKKFIKKGLLIFCALFVFILLGSLISEQIRNFVNLAVYTVLVLLNDDYVSVLFQAGLTDNTSGVGNRFDLYKWVWRELSPDYLLGRGRLSGFSYTYINSDGYRQTKSSIEVEWLRTLYYYGFPGMISEIYVFISLLRNTWKKKVAAPASWEGKLSFTRLVGVLILGYVILFFAVMQNEDVQIFSICVMLLLAYLSNNKFEKVSVN